MVMHRLLKTVNLLNTGHVIDGISEVPLVVSDKVQEYTKTKQAVIFLRRVKAWADVEKVITFVNQLSFYIYAKA